MADVVDTSDEKSAPVLDASIQIVRQRAASMPVGYPGPCDKCGEHSLRLVGGCCARCRDKYKLP